MEGIDVEVFTRVSAPIRGNRLVSYGGCVQADHIVSFSGGFAGTASHGDAV